MLRGIAAILLGTSLGVAFGCAALKNTPAQELAYERWKKCDHFPYVTLKELMPNGEIWVWYRSPDDLESWKRCNRDAWLEQQRTGKVGANQAPPLTKAEAQEVVRFAYFTDEPPPPGTFLRPSVGSNMPLNVKEFPPGKPVTFFWGLNQIGRVIKIRLAWKAPDGRLVKTVERTMRQQGISGSWVWQVETVPASETEQPGRWTVELVVDENASGEYSFIRSPSTGQMPNP